jgi:Ca2+-binding RTX toxin-like protein
LVNLESGQTNFARTPVVGFENAILGRGNDTIIGNVDDNILNGGAGNDTLIGGPDVDHIAAGPGDDTIVFTADDPFD